MPQMMPLNWLTLFFYTILIFFMFNIMNYYSFNYQIKSFKIMKKPIKYYWKW
uniref:ATP synthase complex subunit 8 n=1 Tax=Entomoscelis adonidis TaxID=75503 RepID=A0A3G1GSH9_9CUCU|nr:ATP synthase F0 subunit 8 [Entomoscelis adonidis]